MSKWRIINDTLIIRLSRKGCANRPLYHVIVGHNTGRNVDDGIEQLGVYDPVPNERNERLLSLNVDRFKHYVANGAAINCTVSMLLGTAGVLPLHPHSLTLGWRQRQFKLENEQLADEKEKTAA